MIKFFVVLGIIGAGFFAFGYPQPASVIWLFSNAGLANKNFEQRNIAQGILFSTYWILAVIGTLNYIFN